MEVIVDELVTRLQTANATPFVVPEHATPLSYFSRSTILATRSVIFPGLPTSLSHLQEYLAVLASQQAYSVGLLLLRGVTALERYLLRYPAVFHTLWQQHLALYPGNTLVAQRHLQCAAAELAVEAGEPYLQSYCLEQPPATTSPEPQPPHRRLSLRTYEPTWAVQSLPDGQLLTRLSAAQALRYGFSGALYRRDGQAFHVERVLPERRRLVVRPIRATYHTRGMVQTAITDLQMAAAACHEHWRITYGSLVYTETLHSYERLDIHTGERTSVHAVPEYQRALRTQGTWLGFPVMATPDILTAAHTVVHAVLAAIPLLLANSEVRLHGGVYPIPRENHDNDVEAVFIDEDAGGNGASAFLYSAYEQVLRAALQILLQCDCTQGCKRCLTALSCNSCGSTARLERQAGIGLLQHLLAEAAPAFASVTLPGVPVAPQHLYLCLTTQKSAEDVGGWQHRHLLGLGMAVTYNTRDRLYRVYSAETVTDLLDSLRQAELIIGFNPADFDYQVLQPYTTTPLTTLPTLAILSDVQQHLGFRVSLSHLVRETLGIERPDESIQTLSWFQQGRRERIVEYCRRDLDLIRALIRHGATQGNLWYSDHTEQRQSLPVHWQDIEPHG
jgi:DEAD/DEAH box helicase domain-containing protein